MHWNVDRYGKKEKERKKKYRNKSYLPVFITFPELKFEKGHWAL